MATTGAIAPTSASTYGAGTYPWSNVTNVLLNDTARALTGNDPETQSDFISIRFTFSAFPSSSTIDGLVLRTYIRDFAGSTDSKDSNVQLSKSSTSADGTNLAVATVYLSTYETRTYGTATELWGQAWTAAELEAGSCYAHISCQDGSFGTGSIIHLQYVDLEAYYTVTGISGPPARRVAIAKGMVISGVLGQ